MSGGLTGYLAVWSFGRPGLSGHACLVSGHGHSIAVMAAGPLVGVFVADTRLHNTTINPPFAGPRWQCPRLGFRLAHACKSSPLAWGGRELTALPFVLSGYPPRPQDYLAALALTPCARAAPPETPRALVLPSERRADLLAPFAWASMRSDASGQIS